MNAWLTTLAQAGSAAKAPVDQKPIVPQSTATAPAKSGSNTGTTTTAPAGAKTGNAKQQQQPGAGGGEWMFLFLAVIVVFWFFLFSGGRKEKKKKAAMLAALKKGDKVQTIGGVVGTVVEVRDVDVVVKVDENSNTRMRFVRGAIQSILQEKE